MVPVLAERYPHAASMISRSARILAESADLLLQLGAQDVFPGKSLFRQLPRIRRLIQATGSASLLDYGCGKGTLKPAIASINPDLTVLEYDPAIPGKDALPTNKVDVIAALAATEMVLKGLGYPVKLGSGVGKAQEILMAGK